MKQIIDISDELYSIFKKHGIMAFDYLNEYDKDQIAIAIAQSTPYNPTGDCISREALKEHKVYSEERHEYVVPVYNIDNAPPVEARPQGEWLFKHNSSDIWCSVCDENFNEIPQAFNFCPNCGAEMRGAE